MKNITVSVEDELYHAARIAAAQHRTNVTAVLRSYLVAFVKGKVPPLGEPEDDGDRKNREDLVRLFQEANLVMGYEPGRDRTYER